MSKKFFGISDEKNSVRAHVRGRRALCAVLAAVMAMSMALAGCGGKGAGIPYEENMKSYASVIESLPEGLYYAFADMSPKHDALLVGM